MQYCLTVTQTAGINIAQKLVDKLYCANSIVSYFLMKKIPNEIEAFYIIKILEIRNIVPILNFHALDTCLHWTLEFKE